MHFSTTSRRIGTRVAVYARHLDALVRGGRDVLAAPCGCSRLGSASHFRGSLRTGVWENSRHSG